VEVPDWPTNGRPDVNVRGLSDNASSFDDVLTNSRSTVESLGENMYSPLLL
jgi:hypothetical protein